VSDVHLDGIIMTPRIKVDGRVVAEHGLVTV
jgi:leucyl aminopeptidase (aminopeptidase T)